ncbi:hypothetical protein QFC21_004622 [Naganishia friedmannii]|uniref:Uncharacterized protein n=1 Tax=Naganishia friedmannii TaxID=89922 RepID=A0ACC2VEM6_9TREE|nr:hypothetical protein QFC21_004622 [Naganishia friedmannii]
MANLDDLPVDILYEIHLLSLSEHLPLINRYLYAALSHPTVTRAARWLIRKYYYSSSNARQQRDSRWLCKALECGVCDLEVLQELERIWRDEERSVSLITATPNDAASSATIGDSNTARPRREPLTCPLLPKRIFRHRRSTTSTLAFPIPPILHHLFTTYTPSPNSHRGYPLCRAVMYADIPLINYLLRRGADPAEKDFLALQIGISRRDMRVVRLLVDGPGDEEEKEGQDSSREKEGMAVDAGTGSKRKRLDTAEINTSKRQKHATTSNGSSSSSSSSRTSRPSATNKFPGVRLTQPLVDSVVARGSPEMIQFIIQDRGYMPSLKAIVKLK